MIRSARDVLDLVVFEVVGAFYRGLVHAANMLNGTRLR